MTTAGHSQVTGEHNHGAFAILGKEGKDLGLAACGQECGQRGFQSLPLQGHPPVCSAVGASPQAPAAGEPTKDLSLVA